MRWDGHIYPLLPRAQANQSGAVVPIRVDTHPGSHLLELLPAGSDTPTATRAVTIHSRWFPHQSIHIPASTLRSYDDPRNKADDQTIIDKLKAHETSAQHWSGVFRLPIQARRSTLFGQSRDYNGGAKTSWHKGTDLAGYEGQPIHAPAAGTVIHVARGLVNGNTVVLDHGMGLGTVYLHMQRVDVKVGQSVAAGQVIGRVGGTGGFAPHLHWEARLDTVPIDPESLTRIPKDWR